MVLRLGSLERAKATPVTEARVRKLIADAGGGGGGPVAWGDVTGKPATFPPESHTHASTAIADSTTPGRALLTAVDAAAQRTAMGAQATLVSATNIKTVNGNSLLGSGDLVVSASVLSGLATVSVPNSRLEWSETVAAVGVTASQRIMVSIGSHLDADENDAEMLDVAAMSAAAGTDQITLEMAFSTPVSGPIKINWMAV